MSKMVGFGPVAMQGGGLRPPYKNYHLDGFSHADNGKRGVSGLQMTIPPLDFILFLPNCI